MSKLWLGVLGLLLVTGCASGKNAAHAASARTGCPLADIETVEDGGTGALLDVCGKRQLWMLSMDGSYEPAQPRHGRTAER